MHEISLKAEINETEQKQVENYKEIKPETEKSPKNAREYWVAFFSSETEEDEDSNEDDNPEEDVNEVIDDYIDDLKEKSEFPETIPDRPFDKSDLKKVSPEENAEKRDEFSEKKAELKKEWEKQNGESWPKYDQDVYSENGKLIRKAGSDYDAHHIQPLGMGGKNEASNIAPLNAEVHYDKQGVHSPDSAYSKLDKMLGDEGNEQS